MCSGGNACIGFKEHTVKNAVCFFVQFFVVYFVLFVIYVLLYKRRKSLIVGFGKFKVIFYKKVVDKLVILLYNNLHKMRIGE